MIISEKQVMQLMNLARAYDEYSKNNAILGKTKNQAIEAMIKKLEEMKDV